jgi:hypothetical protein
LIRTNTFSSRGLTSSLNFTCDYSIISGQQLALDARMTQGMEKNSELTEGIKTMKHVKDDKSWFRDTLHYWAEASLPLAYAVACVEVVSKSSEKAGILYLKPDVIENDSYLLTTEQTWA